MLSILSLYLCDFNKFRTQTHYLRQDQAQSLWQSQARGIDYPLHHHVVSLAVGIYHLRMTSLV